MNLKICNINVLVSMTSVISYKLAQEVLGLRTWDNFKWAKINVCYLRSCFFGIFLLVQAEAIQTSHWFFFLCCCHLLKCVNQSSTVLLFSYKTYRKGTFNLKNGDKNEGIALVRRKGPTEAILPQGFHKEVWSSLLCHRDFCGILICHHDTIISILLTFVSNFFFLSGNNITLAYGSEVPLKSFAGTSCASTTPTAREFSLKL